MKHLTPYKLLSSVSRIATARIPQSLACDHGRLIDRVRCWSRQLHVHVAWSQYLERGDL